MPRAFRFVRRRPLFFWAMVATLALGVGANTAVLAAVRTVLLDPAPWSEPDRVVVFQPVNHFSPTAALYAGDVEALATLTSLSDVAGCTTTRVYLSRDKPSVQVAPMEVTAHFFDLFDTPPLMGRTLAPVDFAAGERVAVLSYDLWRTAFAGDRDIVGRRVNLGHVEAAVVGVMPRRFQPFCWSIEGPIAWIPIAPATGSGAPPRLHVFARLAPGVSLEAADAERAALVNYWSRDYGDDHLEEYLLAPAQATRARELRAGLVLLQSVVVLLLLIASANIAGAFLLNASERQREFALRASLGATPWQIVRLVGSEAAVVALAGAAAGAAVALGLVRFLGSLAAPVVPGVVLTAGWRDALTALGIAAVSLVVFGTISSLAAVRTARVRSSEIYGPSRSVNRLRGALVVVQVSLTVVLLVGGTMFLRSYWNAITSSAGFATDGLLTTDVHLPPATSATERAAAARRALVTLEAELSAAPAVREVAFGQFTPFGGGSGVRFDITPAGAVEPIARSFSMRAVSANYFSVLGIPVLQGRPFDDSDGVAEAVVSETFSALFEPGQPLPGTIVALPSGPVRIVGIVGDTKTVWLTVSGRPTLYVPMDFAIGPTSLSIVAQTSNVPAATMAIREAVGRANPGGPPTAVEPLGTIVWRSEQVRRFYVVLTAAFALIGLAVSALGIFGVVGRMVTLRAKDFAVRVALGAGQRRVAGIVLLEAFRPVIVGIAVGAAGGFALARFLEAHPLPFSGWYQVSAGDASTYLFVALVAITTTTLASLTPLRRAMRISPAEVLKGD